MLATIDIVASLLLRFAQAAPTIIQTVDQIKPFAARLIDTIQGKTDITDAELAELQAMVDALFAEAAKPLPPAQPGDPDYTGTP